jgi:excinuclease UvrABC nuclease subunit
LLERTRSVTHEVVSCELDALLLESARIRALAPPYNVQTRARRGCPFLRLEVGLFPRAGATRLVGADAASTGGPAGLDEPGQPAAGAGWYAGPYRTTQQVRHTLETVRRVFQIRSCRRRLPATRPRLRIPCLRLGQGLCPAPCAEAVTPEQYAVLVDYAWRYVTPGREATLAALDARLAELAGAGQAAGWEHRILAECRARLRRVRREYRPLEGGLAGGTLLMTYPAAGGGAILFVVRDGKLVRRVVLDETQLAEPVLVPLIAAAIEVPPAEDARLDADQANILLRWIHRHTGQPECIPAGPGQSPASLAQVVRAALDLPAEPAKGSPGLVESTLATSDR